jgi:hypothetical protein
MIIHVPRVFRVVYSVQNAATLTRSLWFSSGPRRKFCDAIFEHAKTASCNVIILVALSLRHYASYSAEKQRGYIEQCFQ